MADFRKRVRTSLVTVLSDATNGFNAKLASLAATYAITAFTINFNYPSRNFVVGFLEPPAIDMATVIEFPGLVLHAADALNDHSVKNFEFSGEAIAVLQFWLQYRALVDRQTAGNQITEQLASFDLDSIPDAVEDALGKTLRAGEPTFLTNACNLVSGPKFSRDPIIPFGDGHAQRIVATLGFEVHA